jgi:ubiquinone/menaquinone biosynthesis C-methylase UbiE
MTLEEASDVAACCSTVYGSPLAEILVGESFHPGGLTGTRHLLEAGRLRLGARLLDVGCGLGASARLAATEFGLRVDAVDASPAIVARARSKLEGSRVRWATASLPDLPFENDSFDAVLAECVLSTMDRRPALAEIARVLKPDGVLMISDVEAAGVAIPAIGHDILGTALCISDAWRPAEMDKLLAEIGFAIIDRADRSRAIAELASRIDARLSVVDLAARDLGLDLTSLLGPMLDGPNPTFSVTAARAAIEPIREAVQDGTLRYTAVVANRVAAT